MGRHAHRPVELRGTFFRGSTATRLGLLTKHQLHGPAWRRVFQDVYVDSEMPDSHLLRCNAATLILPPGAVLTGRSAACLRGLPLGDQVDLVQVVTRPGTRLRAAGFTVSQTSLPETQIIPGRPGVTTPGRTAWEIAGEPDLVEAVTALDVLLGHGYVQSETLARWAAASPRSRATRAIGLADRRAESPQESRARVKLILAGIPAPVPQYEVWSGPLFVARLDLAWPAARVACEYDGVWHSDARQLRADRTRLNKLVAAGWTVLHLTARDLSDPVRFTRFVTQLRTVLPGS